MTTLAALIAATCLACLAAGYAAGWLHERWRWRRRLDVLRCWRCGGSGAEPYYERRDYERWRGEP